jgi:hypothetical protein
MTGWVLHQVYDAAWILGIYQFGRWSQRKEDRQNAQHDAPDAR